ncbi:MAG: glycosyltransferase [Chitinophagaceae bacterium]|nr:MAG: glycosyltransferase [Chitinophagaceae bacterium]
MIRICESLAGAGYRVTLVGRTTPASLPLQPRDFRQKRLGCIFPKGPLFYIEYNVRLFFYLLFAKASVLCAIDLDSILPVLVVSKLRRIKRVYDAHELFCEMQEIVERPRIYRIWKCIEKISVPSFRYGYTVNQPIADEFQKMYNRHYEVIRNMPLLRDLQVPAKPERFILYQGAVNEGRSFDTLIPAMQLVNARLVIAGTGNYMDTVKTLIAQHRLEGKIVLLGNLLPADLRAKTREAYIGVTLFEHKGLSNYYSLANRYFDYLHAGVPQLCVDYPVYHELNKTAPVAVLTEGLSPERIALKLNMLLENDDLYRELQANCLVQRQTLNWQQEEKKLIHFYKQILGS